MIRRLLHGLFLTNLRSAWLDENCGADGWAITPSGTRGVLNDAFSVYFADVTLASAFVARWSLRAKAETGAETPARAAVCVVCAMQ